MIVLFIVILAVVNSIQGCSCPASYAQEQICDAELVIQGKIVSSRGVPKAFPEDIIYNIFVEKVFHGDKAQENKMIELKTPISSARCGSVTLTKNDNYILTVYHYDSEFSHDLCGYQRNLKDVTPELLQKISTGYRKNCQCQIPSAFGPVYLYLTDIMCGEAPSGCDYESLCAEINGKCKWVGSCTASTA